MDWSSSGSTTSPLLTPSAIRHPIGTLSSQTKNASPTRLNANISFRKSTPSSNKGNTCETKRPSLRMAFSIAPKSRIAGRAVLVPHDGFFGLGCGCCLGSRSDRADRHDAFDRLLAQNMLAVQLGHAGVLGILLQFGVARANLFFARVLGDAGLLEGVVGSRVNVLIVEDERVLGSAHAHLLAAGEDLVTAMLVVPLGERGGHVHLLDDVAPAHAGVVRAEADLAFLRGVRDDALLGAAEVVVEQILEPHAGDEEEVPAIGERLFDVGHGAGGGHLAVLAAGGSEALVELRQQIKNLEVRRRLGRIVVAQQGERDANNGEELAAGGVVDLGNVLGQAIG